jgi:hypothetical protein
MSKKKLRAKVKELKKNRAALLSKKVAAENELESTKHQRCALARAALQMARALEGILELAGHVDTKR